MPLAAQLHKLQMMDSKVGTLETALTSLDDGSTLAAQVAAARAAEESARADLHDRQSRLRGLELELQSTTGKARKMEGDLYGGRVTNPKELQAMEQDIQMLHRQQGRMEDDMLNLMEEIEGLLGDVHRLESDRQAKEQALASHLETYRKSREDLTAELEAVRAERESFAPQLDADLLKRYERLRSRKDGLAVAAIVNGVCSGCRFRLPEQLVARVVEQDVILTCEECGRILYGGAE